MGSASATRAKRGMWIGLILLTTVLLITITAGDTGPGVGVLSVQFNEDALGEMTLTKAVAKGTSWGFTARDSTTLSIGQSRSTWWVRMMMEKPAIGEDAYYLTINTPTVERVVLHLPIITSAGLTYERRQAGWGFQGDTQDEGFNYPVFRLPHNLSWGSPVYLQLYSPYTQNYPFSLLHERELSRVSNQLTLVSGLFFGLLLAMGINNFVNFLMLRDRVHLHYVLYILSMVLYQAALLGTYRIVLGSSAESLIAHVITFGIVMVGLAILFFRSFLHTSAHFPTMDRIAKFLLLLCPVIMVLMIAGFRYEASLASTVIGMATGNLVVVTTLMAVRRGIRQANYFLAGWCAMLLSLFIFAARVWGLIPNSHATLFVVILSAAVEATFLSAALADRTRVMREERESALQLYKDAEESSVSKESAFLQAQIRPHFLYNTLNIIATLCRMDSEKAREVVLDLSSYLRHSIDFRNLSRYVTLEEELEFIQAYVKIEQARFRDKLQVVYEVGDTSELVLPPLMLEPLVENAIRHGIRKSQGRGTVTIRVQSGAGGYAFEVEDDGVGMDAEQLSRILSDVSPDSGGVGLANIRKRLAILYGTELEIESRPGVGTRVTFHLPRSEGDTR